MKFPSPLAWLLGSAIRRHQRRKPGAPVDIAWLPLPVRLFVRGLSEYDVGFTQACVDGSVCDMNHEDCLSRVRCPMLLIAAHSFRDETLGLVGAMDDADRARAQRVKSDLTLETWPTQHVVHLAKPKQYIAAIDTLARKANA